MNHSRWRNVENLFLIFVFIFLNTLAAIAGPSRTTYQAKIIKPDGYPLESSNVNFKFTILDQAGSCILYAETYSAVNMSATGGLISFALGSGVKTYPVSATTFEQVFSNITPSLSCDAGGPPTYSPGPNDTRKIVMQFHDGAGWQTLPAMSINAVPYAMYANEAQKLNGKTEADFVQISTVPTCAASEALKYNGSSFSCIAVGSGSTPVTSGAVVTALGYTPADGASVTALNSSLSTTNSNVSSVSSTVSTLAANLSTVSASVFSVSSTVSSLSTSVSSLTSTVSGISTTVSGLSASMAALVSSQWASNGSKIYYNSGYVGIGTSNPLGILHTYANSAVYFDRAGTSPTHLLLRSASGSIGSEAAVISGQTLGRISFQGYNGTSFTTAADAGIAGIADENWTSTANGSSLHFYTNPNGSVGRVERLVITNSGTVGVGTANPVTKLDVAGGLRISMESATCAASYAGTMRYNTGTLEFCNGTTWSALGVAGAGITNVNGSTSGSQTFANGTAGTAPAFVTNNGVHTLNIPLASAASVTGGLLSNADYTTFMGKITSSAASIAQVLGYTPASATALSGYVVRANNLSDLASSATARTNLGIGYIGTLASVDLGSADVSGTLAIARTPAYAGDVTKAAASNTLILSNSGVTAGTYTKVTVDAKGRVTSSSALNVSDVTTALGYTPASASASTQWTTSGSAIYYSAGSVGIGTSAPQAEFHVHDTGTTTEFRISNASTGAGAADGFNIRTQSSDVTLNNFESGDLIVATSNTERLRVTAAGSLGVGTSAPSGTLHTIGSLPVYHDRVGAQAAHLALRSANGTTSSMTARLVGEELGLLSFGGYDGSTYRVNDTGIVAVAGETWAGPNNNGSLLMFKTKTNGVAGMASVRMVISSSGAVGLGTTTPSAKLHISAGTSSAAPLKLTSGPLLNSAEAGAIEYDGTNLFYTDSTNTRRALSTGSASGSIDNASVINSTGNISMVPVGSVIVSSTTSSVSPLTGALVVNGGAGISGNLNVSGSLAVSSAITINNAGNLNFRAAAGTPSDAGDIIFRNYDDSERARIYAGTSVSGALHFSVGPTPSVKMAVVDSGNVGIGTTAPSARLTVISSAPATTVLRLNASSGSSRLIATESAGSRMYLQLDDEVGATKTLLHSNGDSYFNAGKVGIGTAVPTSLLHIASGTTALAPFKFTSGTLTTAAQSGAVEYDGFNLYFTDGSNTRRLIATTAGVGSIDNASTITSTGNISMVPVGSVIVSSTTASTNSNTGALVVKGGVGITGDLYSSGTITTSSDIQGLELIATSATITPYIYGSTVSGGSLRLESTTHSTKGNVLLATGGGYVGIGTSNPTGVLDVRGGDAAANTAGNSINFTAQNAGAGGATGGSINFNAGAGTSGWPGGSVNITTVRGQSGALAVSNNFTSAYTSSATTAVYPAYNLRVNNGWNANGNSSLILFSSNNSTSLQQYAYFGAVSVSGAAVYGPDLVIGARTGVNSYNELMKIQTSNGNVGIGTTTPASRLHLSDNSAVLATIERQNNQNSLIEYKNTAGSMYTGLISGSSDWGVGTGNDLATSNVLRVANSGRVYIGGTAAPMARLHLTAGTSSVAPMKINAGPLLTSPQSGTIEYDGTDYYITDNTLARRAIATVSGGSLNNISVVSSTSEIALWPAAGNSVVVSSTTASTNSNTGSLVVKGGLGVAGNIFASGTIITSSNIQGASITATSGMVSPYIYGSTLSSGDLILDSTTNATKGSIVLAPTGGYVGIGNLNPVFALDVSGTVNSVGTQADVATVSSAAFRINQRVHDGASDFGGIGMLNSGANRSDTAIFYGDDNTEALRFVHVRSASPNYNLYEYMRLTPDGKLGLGTNSPSYLMDLYGSASPTLRIRSASNDTSSGPTIRLTEDLSENGGFVRYQSIINALDLGVIENGVENRALSINRSTGNIGIGTTASTRKLHILSTGGGGVEIEDTTSPFLHLRRDGSNEWYMTAASSTSTLEWRAGSNANPAILAMSTGGNIGMGTSAPSAKLHIVDSPGGGSMLKLQRSDNASDRVALSFIPNGTISSTNTQWGMGKFANSDTFSLWGYDGSVVAERFTVDNNGGFVGIGAAAPSFKLEVQASANSGKGILLYGNSTSSAAPYLEVRGRRNDGNNSSAFSGGLALAGLRTDAAVSTNKKLGTIYFGGNHTDGTEANLLYSASINGIAEGNFSNATTMPTGIAFNTGSAGTALGSANVSYGSERMRIDANGNVGIGTTAPSALLDVVGSLNGDTIANIRNISSGTAARAGVTLTNAGTGYGSDSGGLFLLGVSHTTGEKLQLFTNSGIASGIEISASAANAAVVLSTQATERLRVASSGNVGIGTSNPQYKLEVSGGARLVSVNGSDIWTERPDSDIDIRQGVGSTKRTFSIHGAQGGGDVVNIYANNAGSYVQAIAVKNISGNVGILNSAPAYTLDVGGVVNIVSGSSLRFGGTIVCTSAGCTSSSDQRLKENIKPLDFSLEKLLSLNAVQYDWKDKQKFGQQHEIGFIAQDLEKVYPEVVRTQKDSGFKSVAYDKLVAPIIVALKVFNSRIMSLFDLTEKNAREIASVKEENAELRARVERTEKENQELKERLERIEKALSKSGTK